MIAALPAAALASSGGASTIGTAPTTAPAVQTADVPVTVSGDGITLQTDSSAILRRNATFSGTAPQSLAGDTVAIQRARNRGRGWTTIASAAIASDGTFLAGWRVNHAGRLAIRATIAEPGSAQTASVTPSVTVTAYRPAVATQYGPGFYGHRTACGERLRRGTIGVASRTLKCGTPVAIVYHGQMLVVPVIDRGPYAHGVTWDLTMATGRALGIDGTARIAAITVPAG